jgi:protein TonB
MNAVRKSVLMLSLAALASAAFAAKSSEEAYLATTRKGPGVPVPVTVVTPAVPSGYAGEVLEVSFTVDETGKPVNLSASASADEGLVSPVLAAVEKWRFEPAKRDGVPVATKVVLPVRILGPEIEGFRIASY